MGNFSTQNERQDIARNARRKHIEVYQNIIK